MIVVAERDSWDADFHQSRAGPVFYPTRTAVTSTVDFTFLGFICSALISSKMDIFLYQQMESVDFFNREYFILHVTLGLICQCLRSRRKWTLFQDRGKWGPHFSTHLDVNNGFFYIGLWHFSTRLGFYTVLLVILWYWYIFLGRWILVVSGSGILWPNRVHRSCFWYCHVNIVIIFHYFFASYFSVSFVVDFCPIVELCMYFCNAFPLFHKIFCEITVIS